MMMILAEGGFFDFAWWQWLLIVGLIGLIAFYVIMKKKGNA